MIIIMVSRLAPLTLLDNLYLLVNILAYSTGTSRGMVRLMHDTRMRSTQKVHMARHAISIPWLESDGPSVPVLSLLPILLRQCALERADESEYDPASSHTQIPLTQAQHQMSSHGFPIWSIGGLLLAPALCPGRPGADQSGSTGEHMTALRCQVKTAPQSRHRTLTPPHLHPRPATLRHMPRSC